MRIVLQRVSHAAVSVQGSTVGAIGAGLLLLVGLAEGDDERTLEAAIEKIVHLRIFPDERGRFHYSALDTHAEILLVSQFTLFADTSKGRRPDFFGALHPSLARPLFERFVENFRARYPYAVAAGEFGAEMKVALQNNGPVTLVLEF